MSRGLCEQCGARRGKAEYDNGSYCYSCGYKDHQRNLYQEINKGITEGKAQLAIPEKDSDELPKEAIAYLLKYYITDELIKKYNIFWSMLYQRICFPIYFMLSPDKQSAVGGCWMRDIPGTKKDKWLYVGQKELKMQLYNNKRTPSVCIVEDTISAIRVSEYMDVVCLCGTSYNDKLVPIILNYESVLLMLDGDEAGQKGNQNLKKKLGIFRPIKIIKVKKDPKCFSDQELELLLCQI